MNPSPAPTGREPEPRADHGPDHPHVATAVNNLGSVLLAEGKLDGAKQCYERALHIDEANHGPDHPSVATSLNNLAALYRATGQILEAQELERRLSDKNQR